MSGENGAKVKVKSSSLFPVRKVATGVALGTPLAIVIDWAWNTFVPGYPMPSPVSVALGSIVTGLVAWFTAPKEGETKTILER